ncbi:hypothetical protein [Dyadobacter tibetensis]|uniref:hypothetical protein n=1 Tax=Dyadobacter tibetensis TaxID=1211851 RepID=UPI0004B2E816|nr:hypothetical protein [Dyadobacter tibetensis]
MKPTPHFNASGYSMTSDIDGLMLVYVPKENNATSTDYQIDKNYYWDQASVQWFNTLTGAYTEERKYSLNPNIFWVHRPWKMEADAIIIIKGLRPKTK